MPATSPDNIYYPDAATGASFETALASMAGSVQDALGSVANYRYVQTVYFTASGTFAKADYPWLRAIRVRCVGGGGGGGGSLGGSGNSLGSGAGGGGFAEAFITDIAGLAATVAVTVGAGGAGGAAGNNNGATGGATSFGALASATGGAFGEGCINTTGSTTRNGGLGGAGTVGDLWLSGGDGGGTRLLSGATSPSGVGGGSGLNGAGVRSSEAIAAGRDAPVTAYGAGGSGAWSTSTSFKGGNGAAGILIVELFA